MPAIYLIRHAESTSNAGGIALPNADIPLSGTGHIQARQLAERLSIRPAAVFTSTFIRTRQTAQPWLDKLGIEAQALELIREFDMLGYNVVKGLNAAQRAPYAANYRKRADLDLRIGDGETFREFSARIEAFLHGLNSYPDQSVFFTHGMFIRLIVWRLLGMRVNSQNQLREFFQFHGFAIPNTAVFRLHWQQDYRDAGIKLMPEESPVTAADE